jgi:hypothetical protein
VVTLGALKPSPKLMRSYSHVVKSVLSILQEKPSPLIPTCMGRELDPKGSQSRQTDPKDANLIDCGPRLECPWANGRWTSQIPVMKGWREGRITGGSVLEPKWNEMNHMHMY